MSILRELKRRNVYRAGAAYVVAAWLIIQVAGTVFPAFGLGDSAVRLVIIILCIGFVPAVVAAWAFELTPRGLVRERDLDRDSPVFKKLDKRIDRLVMVVLALAVGYFLFERFVLRPQHETAIVQQALEAGGERALADAAAARAERSLVVLPFVDMSRNQDQGYLADGLAEELMTVLARIPDLRVISRTSAFAFKGKSIELSEIARQLNVANVLEGSIRVDGDRIRVTTQLINALDDEHLWAQNYDRHLSEIFAIQDEVAELVVRQLEVRLLGEMPRVERTTPEAYDLYLQSKLGLEDYTMDNIAASIAKLEQALSIDPQFVAAWISLGRLYDYQATHTQTYGAAAVERAWSAAENALRLDPYYAAAHSLKGLLMITKNDLPGSVRHFQRAVELAPADPEVLNDVRILLQSLGRFDEARQVLLYLLDRNPLSQQNLYNLAISLVSSGRYEEGEELLHRLVSQNPDIILAKGFYFIALLANGKHEEALDVAQGLGGFYRTWALMLYYKKLGMTQEYAAGLAKIRGMEEGAVNPGQLFQFYASMGEADMAFEHAVPQAQFPNNRFLPTWQPIENDPRWQEFLEGMGCSDEQIKNIEFEFRMPGAG